MKWCWPWKRHRTEGNGHVARAAKAKAEADMREQLRSWPEARRARDVLAEMAERALRGHL